MKISLIHPSRGRAEKSIRNVENWILTSGKGVDIETVLSIDYDDPQKDLYYNLYSNSWIDAMIIVNNNRSAVDAINNAAKVSTGEILIVVSDDTDCFEKWGSSIIEQTSGKNDWIAKCYDGIQKWIITMPLMDRNYYNRFGYIYYPEYKHMFCDTELTCVADLLNRKIELPFLFKHRHYSVEGLSKDSTTLKADATWSQGESLFLRRFVMNFGLSEINGEIKSDEYLIWVKKKLKYGSR